ncbi:MAG TPA: S-layer homology domain-containing protein [Xenococcaceae cyanobacterium]
MTNSSPPPPPPNSSEQQERSRIRQNVMDEWIAVLVAFGVIGAILFWSFGTKSFDGKNVFSRSEGGLFSVAEDPEDILIIESEELEDLNLTPEIEEDLIASSQFATPQTPGTLLSPLNFDFGSRDDSLATGESFNNLLPLAIPPATLPEATLPEAEVEVEPETPAVTEPETEAEVEPETPELVFNDVSEEHWAYPFIQTLGEDNFIIGTANNNFEPDKLITRAGMANLVSQAFEDLPETVPAKNFNDVSENNALVANINKAVKIGFMKGYSDAEFRPIQNIPRYQVLVALATGLDLNLEGEPNSVLANFNDSDQIPEWAREKVAAAVQADLVVNRPGFDFNSLNPTEPATRAEVAAMIYQTLVESNKLQPIESTYILPNPQ